MDDHIVPIISWGFPLLTVAAAVFCLLRFRLLGGPLTEKAKSLFGIIGAAALGLGLGWQVVVFAHAAVVAEKPLPGWMQAIAVPLLLWGLVFSYVTWLRGAYYVTAKELRTYFTSPVAYVVMMAILGVAGLLFWWTLKAYMRQEAPQDVGMIYMTVCFLFALLTPVVTMRLFAEERRSGTYEMLMTHPVRDAQVVIGKWVAGVLVLLAILAALFVQPVIFEIGGNPDWGPICSAYVGLTAWACAFVAIGVFASALTSSQIAAAVMAWFALIILWLLGALETVDPGRALSKVGQYLSVSGGMEEFCRGTLDVTRLVYIASVTIFFLFASVMTLFANRSR